jgi:alpha-amylase/alpha-mannosidase (GH57 family)
MLSLLFGVHAHQPAGNFPEVFESAHTRCYKPFLEILHRYPDFRFAVHFSGPLLDYLFEKHPQDMELLADMVRRGQVEMFGAGDTEPVLASIPERDRIGQVEKLAKKLAWRFGERPTGAWLTERVWEATVVPALAKTGIEYVTVDDYHFLCTGKTPKELDGYFTTEEGGHRLDLFPISEQLRYRFPFSPAAEAVAYLETLATAGDEAAIYFDDIEKFGIWPETYAWVYERGWLREFIERVLASKKVKTGTFREFHAEHRTRGIVYLPTTSYIEMNEWTLPADAAQQFSSLVTREKAAKTYDAHKPFVRGGIWKNFMTRYPEANWMHKRMTGLSQRLEHARSSLDATQALDLETQLYLGKRTTRTGTGSSAACTCRICAAGSTSRW